MLGAFWQAVGGKLADRWAAVSVPALVFWLGGLAAWAYHRGGAAHPDHPNPLAGPANHRHPGDGHPDRATRRRRLRRPGRPAGHPHPAAVGRLLAVLDRPAAPPAHRPARRPGGRRGPRLAARLRRRAAAGHPHRRPGRHLHPAGTPPPAPTRRAGYFLPTPIGNILRAAERRPADKYGLDTVTLWPRLWLLLPDATRQELLAARTSLDNAVTAAIWGLLFCAFTPFTPLAIPIGLAVTTVAVTIVLPARAQVFGDLIEAAYDLHRTALYRQLRWPLPANPAQEHLQGQQLTAYLWRGSDDTTPTFTPPT